jgi:hypothetical protein
LAISTDPFNALRARVRGAMLLPGDPRFDERRRTFNAMLDRRPRVIVQPVDTADVVAAVTWAGAHDLPISVRGGGHSVAGHAVGPDSLMLDLANLRAVTVDPASRIAEAGGGALLEDLDRATTSEGFGAPSGTYRDTGVAGLTLTGGISYLLGAAGFACDALVGAEVVTADARVLQVDTASDPELLWALRGGGGNFGVVTKLRHAMIPLRNVYAGRIRIAGDAVADALRLLFELQVEAASDQLTLQATVGHNRDLGLHGSIIGLWIGEPEIGPRIFAPLRALRGIYLDTVGRTSYLAMQQEFDRMGPTYRHYWKGQFVRDVGAGLQAAILERAAGTPDERDPHRAHPRLCPSYSREPRRIRRAACPHQRLGARRLVGSLGRRDRDRLGARHDGCARAVLAAGRRLPQLRPGGRVGETGRAGVRSRIVRATAGCEASRGPGQPVPVQRQHPARLRPGPMLSA